MDITKCKYCGSENLKFTQEESGIHYGRWTCGHCKRFSHWAKNPDNPRSNSSRVNRKTINDICDFYGIKDIGICFFCLRNRNELGDKETLTIDHIQELNKGGEDQLFNMQVLCSACHKLKNWARLYMNWHLSKKEGDDGKI